MSRDSRYLSEDDARDLWERAARLQAEAAQRAERALARPREGDADTAPDADESTSGDYELTHVRAAAVEAGIGEEFVDAALAEQRAEAVLRRTPPPRRPLSRWILKQPPEFVVEERTIESEPAAVLRAMEQILPHDPYALVLIDRSGDPLTAGTMTFEIPGANLSATGATGLALDASWADLRQVHLTLRKIDGGGATHVTARAPVAWAWRMNAAIGSVLVGFGGAAGTGAGVGLGMAAAAAVASVAAAPVAAVVGATVFATTAVGATYSSLTGLRFLYRWSLERGRKGLSGMLAAIDVRASGGWNLAPEREPEPTPRLGPGWDVGPDGDPSRG